MPKFVYRDGILVDKATGEPMTLDRDYVPLPYTRGDIPGYRSPITGEWIEGRAARREDLAKHGCREVDPSEWHGQFRKEKYARNNWLARKEGRLK